LANALRAGVRGRGEEQAEQVRDADAERRLADALAEPRAGGLRIGVQQEHEDQVRLAGQEQSSGPTSRGSSMELAGLLSNPQALSKLDELQRHLR
jgi:hypothetical protein